MTFNNHTTLNEWIEIYMKEEINSNTECRRRIFADFSKLFGKLRPRELKDDELSNFLETLRKENKYRLKTMDSKKWRLNRFMNFLIGQGVLEHNPVRSRKYHQIYDDVFHFDKALSPEEVQELLRVAKNYSPGLLYPIVLFSYETAVKKIELTSLKWENLELNECIVHLPGFDYLKPRKIKISKHLAEVLGNLPKLSSEHVFSNYKGRPYTKAGLANLTVHFNKRVKFMRKWDVQILRSSYVLHYLQAGGCEKKLKTILGLGENEKIPGLELIMKENSNATL
jgi:integrase